MSEGTNKFAIAKEGTLQKDGSGRMGGFGTRVARLFNGGDMFFFADNKSSELKAALKLRHAIVSPSTLKKKHCFQIITPEKVHHMIAEDEEQMNSWIEAVAKCGARKYDTPFDERFDPSDIAMQGMLSKEGGKSKTWKNRYFVAVKTAPMTMYYFKKKNGELKGSFPLTNATVGTAYVGVDHCFQIETQAPAINSATTERTYYMGAANADEMQKWIAAMQSLGLVRKELIESPAAIVKEGTLVKEGAKSGAWQSRHFVLLHSPKMLHYFLKKDGELRGSIPLESASVSQATSHPKAKPHCFQVQISDRKYFICAATAEEMNDWMETIECVITQNGPPFIRKPPIRGSSGGGGSKGKGVVAGINMQQFAMLQPMAPGARPPIRKNGSSSEVSSISAPNSTTTSPSNSFSAKSDSRTSRTSSQPSAASTSAVSITMKAVESPGVSADGKLITAKKTTKRAAGGKRPPTRNKSDVLQSLDSAESIREADL